VARAFRAEEPDGALLLVGRAGGPEERLVPAAGFELETVRIRGLDRDAVWKNVVLPVLVPAGVFAGLRIVDRFRPDVVLGMGGYVMAPAVWAARLRGVPYVLHEKDVRPGLATRLFAARAAAVCTTLPGTERRLRTSRVVLTGVPLREGFEPRTPLAPARTLLVIGGSQGARRLNQAVWGALEGLLERFSEVIHLAGEQGRAQVERLRRPGYEGLAFSEEVAALMARSDLVLCRAGVSTLAEVTAVGLPAIVVPGSFGGGHQGENAQAVAAAGAAVVVPDEELTPARLLELVDSLNPPRLRAMAAASARLGRRNAAQRVLRVVREVAAAGATP
jgi:UDP-N-acetylglucosamine--N-acetylmuramyl-(pentapeptide) pyrophosphoryl-undecaprenol N-acetylglucosamine transferase